MKYLTDLCEDLQMDTKLKRNESGFYLLPLTSSLEIQIKPLDPGVFFFSLLLPCPKVKKEELFIQLMKANLFGQGTLGSTIALDSTESRLTLSRAIPYDMNYRAFKEALEDFTNIVEYWREEIKHYIDLAKGGIL